MEQFELQLVEKYASQDDELQALWNDHILYSKQLEQLESKAYRTPSEEQTVKQIKKQKLEGKTRLLARLQRYSDMED